MCIIISVRPSHLDVLARARLSLTQHTEQLQDQLLHVLQRLLLGHQVRMHLVQYLNTHTHRSVIASLTARGFLTVTNKCARQLMNATFTNVSAFTDFRYLSLEGRDI